jgi:predicted nucleic acid-binding protein
LGLAAATVRRRVEVYASLPVFRPAAEDLLNAIDLHRLHGVAIWDALIVRAALASGCRVLYTEDLQHGRTFDGLEIVDPFANDRP